MKTKSNKKWCKHVKLEETTYGWAAWYFDNGDSVVDAGSELWKFCPICGAKRPKRK